MLPGSGVEYPGMGRALLHDAAFAAGVARCDAAAAGWFEQPLRAFIAGGAEQGGPGYRSAALAAFCIATAGALAARGVLPSGYLGCSIGEIAVLAITGAAAHADCFRFIAEQADAIATQAPPGGLLFVLGSPGIERRAQTWPGAHLAGVYAPGLILLASADADLAAVTALAQHDGGLVQRVPVPVPVHSALIDPARARVTAAAGTVGWQATPAFLSAAAGGSVTPSARHLWHVVRAPIRFDLAMLHVPHGAHAIDIGPSGALATAARRVAGNTVQAMAITSGEGPDPAALDRIAARRPHFA